MVKELQKRGKGMEEERDREKTRGEKNIVGIKREKKEKIL